MAVDLQAAADAGGRAQNAARLLQEDRASPTARSGPASIPTTRACPTAPTATSRRSPTPSSCTRRSAGSCRDEEKTTEFLLRGNSRTGRSCNVAGTVDPKSAAGRAYNTTKALVALQALGAKPKYDPLPVFDDVLKEDYKTLPPYMTSFFPLAYLACGKPIPPEADEKIRAPDGAGRRRLPPRPRRRHVPRGPLLPADRRARRRRPTRC